MVNALIVKVSYTYTPKNLDLNQKNRVTPPVKSSIEKPFSFRIEGPSLSFVICILGGQQNLRW